MCILIWEACEKTNKHHPHLCAFQAVFLRFLSNFFLLITEKNIRIYYTFFSVWIPKYEFILSFFLLSSSLSLLCRMVHYQIKCSFFSLSRIVFKDEFSVEIVMIESIVSSLNFFKKITSFNQDGFYLSSMNLNLFELMAII